MQTTLVRPRNRKYTEAVKHFSTRLPAQEYDRMFETATRCGMSGASFFRHALDQYCNAVDAFLDGNTENHELEILIGHRRA